MSEIPKEIQEMMKSENFNPSQIKITENDQNVMRPDIMQFLMTASIASQAVKMRKYFDDKESKGWTQNFVIPVVPAVQRFEPDTPAQTIYVINDGPAVIFVEINKRFSSPTQLNNGEDMFIDFETHKLECFFVWGVGAAGARALVTG